MDRTANNERDDEFDWNTEDELEIENYPLSASPCLTPGGEVLSGSVSGEAHGSLPQEQQSADSDSLSSDSEGRLYEERTDIDISESEMSMNFLSF